MISPRAENAADFTPCASVAEASVAFRDAAGRHLDRLSGDLRALGYSRQVRRKIERDLAEASALVIRAAVEAGSRLRREALGDLIADRRAAAILRAQAHATDGAITQIADRFPDDPLASVWLDPAAIAALTETAIEIDRIAEGGQEWRKS